MLKLDGVKSAMILIVAKCIVNSCNDSTKQSKLEILIVAKCIVNTSREMFQLFRQEILIVAKCIVNFNCFDKSIHIRWDINSSKVYCKSI